MTSTLGCVTLNTSSCINMVLLSQAILRNMCSDLCFIKLGCFLYHHPLFFFKDASNYDRFDFHPIQWNKGPWPPAILHFRTCATLLHYQLQSIILKTPSNAVYTVIVGTQNHPLPGFFQRIKYLFLSALDFFQGPCVDFCPGCCDGPCPDCRTSAWTLQNVWCKT